MKELLHEKKVAPDEVVYVGNDLNDLPVLPYVGYFACPQDAHTDVLRRADLALSKPGGRGAIRELVEITLRSEHES